MRSRLMVSQSMRATSRMAGRKALKMKANKKDSMRSAARGKDARQSSAGGDHKTGGHGVNREGLVLIGEGCGDTGKGER